MTFHLMTEAHAEKKWLFQQTDIRAMKEKAKNRQEEKAGMAWDKNEAHPKC